MAGVDASPVNERDMYFGEAFFYAYQDKYVDAITRQEIPFEKLYGKAKPSPDPLHFQFGSSQFSAGDFELAYRMYQRAGRTLKAISESNADQLIRNEAEYRLAQIYLRKNEPEKALKSIDKITGKIPEDIREDVLFLRAQIYLANGKFTDATKLFQELEKAKSYEGFAAYNLGVSLIKSGQEKQGLDQLEKVGGMPGNNDVTLSIRDKANLALGYRLMDAKQPALARQYLDRVRLDGPFSNKALLGSGWAEVTLGKFENALAPWSVLAKRNVSDSSVQESMLGVAYAYAQLNLPGKATLLYGKALEGFDKELTRLDASIKSVGEGKLLPFLLRKELEQGGNWIAKFKSLPEAPETRYLLEMMASGDFQDSLKNYLDLNDLSKRLESWDENLNAYQEITGLRRKYYESQLPGIDKQFSAQETKMKLRLKQRQNLDAKYGSRLAEAYKRLKLVDDDIGRLKAAHASFINLRQSAPQSYQGYDDQIRQLKSRVHDARQKVNALMVKQGQMLEMMAVSELNWRRDHLQQNQAQAKLALVENFERAKKQSAAGGAK
jgi:tetratricopeptide (TPR) repeat protein